MKQAIQVEYNMVKIPIRQEANQLAIFQAWATILTKDYRGQIQLRELSSVPPGSALWPLSRAASGKQHRTTIVLTENKAPGGTLYGKTITGWECKIKKTEFSPRI